MNIASTARPLSLRVSSLSFRLRRTARRARNAWEYLRGTMQEETALDIHRECMDAAGTYTLESIDVPSVIESARERWGDVPGIERYCARAAERVYSKWNSTGDASSAAEDWAMDLIEGYADDRGITLADRWQE